MVVVEVVVVDSVVVVTASVVVVAGSVVVVGDSVVVVVSSVVVVAGSVVVVVAGTASRVNAESGTISHGPLLIRQASMKHAPPPHSKNQPSSGSEPDSVMKICWDHEQPFRFHVPNSVCPTLTVPPSSAATIICTVEFSGIVMNPE